MYEKIRSAIMELDDFFKCTPDAAGRLGAPISLCLYTFITMVHKKKTTFSKARKLSQLEPQNMKCMKRFCKAIVNLYE